MSVFGNSGVKGVEVGNYLDAQFCGEVGDEVIVWVAGRLVVVDGC